MEFLLQDLGAKTLRFAPLRCLCQRRRGFEVLAHCQHERLWVPDGLFVRKLHRVTLFATATSISDMEFPQQ
jgi:hypothetical protein